MADIWVILAYLVIAILILALGDGLGARSAHVICRRSQRSTLIPLPLWLSIPIAIALPGCVLAGVLYTAMRMDWSTMEMIADHIEVIVLAAIFITGLIGGFFSHVCRPRSQRHRDEKGDGAV